jgi:hypothetical protein
MTLASVPIEIRGNDWIFYPTVTFAGSIGLPEDILEAKHWNPSGDPLEATNVVHQSPLRYVQAHGSDVAAATEYLFEARKTTDVLDVVVVVDTPPTGDYEITVDVQKYSSSAWASILNGGAETIDSSASADTPTSITLSGTAGVTELAAGELLRVVVTASGTTGTQAQGLMVQTRVHEQPK